MNPSVYYTQLIAAVQSLAEATRAQLGTLERISLTLDRIEQKGISIGKPPATTARNLTAADFEREPAPNPTRHSPGVPPPVPPHRPQAPRAPATKRTLR